MTVEKDTTLWREPEQREKEGGRAVLFVLLGLLALLGGALRRGVLRRERQGAARHHRRGRRRGRPHPGRRGRRRSSAARRPRSPRRSTSPSATSVAAWCPPTAGLSVDYEASIEAAGAAAQSWSPELALGLLHRGRRPRRRGDRRRADAGRRSSTALAAEVERRRPARARSASTPAGVKVTAARASGDRARPRRRRARPSRRRSSVDASDRPPCPSRWRRCRPTIDAADVRERRRRASPTRRCRRP